MGDEGGAGVSATWWMRGVRGSMPSWGMRHDCRAGSPYDIIMSATNIHFFGGGGGHMCVEIKQMMRHPISREDLRGNIHKDA